MTYYTFDVNWSKPRLFLSLHVLILLLVWPVNSGAIRGTVATCHPRDRDPCANFPELCSAGNGLCVVKKPCEYECVCPPDGRVGRDCSNGKGQSSDRSGQGNTGGTGTPSNDKQVDSLLVFPPDLFWDLNHVAQQEDLIKTIPAPGVTAAQTTTYSSQGVEENTPTVPVAIQKTEVRGETMSFPKTANGFAGPTLLPTILNTGFQITTNAADLTTLSTSNKPNTDESSTPATLDLTSADTVTGFGPETEANTSTPSPTTRLYTTQYPYIQTTFLSSSSQVSTESFTQTPTPPSSKEVITTNTNSERSPELLILSQPITHSTEPPNILGTPKSGQQDTVFPSTTSPLESNAHTPKNLEHPQVNSNSLSIEGKTSHYGMLQHTAEAFDTLKPTTPSLVLNSEMAIVNKPISPNHPARGQNSFPTFFSGSARHAIQDISDNRALHRTVQRVFHPMDAFQMLPRP